VLGRLYLGIALHSWSETRHMSGRPFNRMCDASSGRVATQ